MQVTISQLSKKITDKIIKLEERHKKAMKLHKLGPEAEQLIENQIHTLYWVQTEIDKVIEGSDDTGRNDTELQREETKFGYPSETFTTLSKEDSIS